MKIRASLKGRSHLSKMGSSQLQKALYFPAIVDKSHSSILKAVAQKLSKKVNILWLLFEPLCASSFISSLESLSTKPTLIQICYKLTLASQDTK